MYEKYFEQLSEECLIRNRSSRTAEAYISNIASFMKWTGNKPMEELCLQDAREFILFKRKSGVSASTCNFYNSSIAFLYKHVLHIPWDQDIVPRMRIDARLPEVLSLSEVEALIATASHIRNKAIIALLYSSGLRVGELVKLTLIIPEIFRWLMQRDSGDRSMLQQLPVICAILCSVIAHIFRCLRQNGGTGRERETASRNLSLHIPWKMHWA